MSSIFVARQPIFEVGRGLYGYELLYRRDASTNRADGEDGYMSAEVIVGSLLGIGLPAISGGRRRVREFFSRPASQPELGALRAGLGDHRAARNGGGRLRHGRCLSEDGEGRLSPRARRLCLRGDVGAPARARVDRQGRRPRASARRPAFDRETAPAHGRPSSRRACRNGDGARHVHRPGLRVVSGLSVQPAGDAHQDRRLAEPTRDHAAAQPAAGSEHERRRARRRVSERRRALLQAAAHRQRCVARRSRHHVDSARRAHGGTRDAASVARGDSRCVAWDAKAT